MAAAKRWNVTRQPNPIRGSPYALGFFSPVLLIASASLGAARADTLPVGTYNLSAHTLTNTTHQSVDQGTLSGTLVFSASSVLTSANLVFNDTTDGLSFTFTVPGLTTYTPAAHLLDAIIYNASSASISYAFSIATNGTTNTFNLTCGVDCATDASIPDSSGRNLNEELFGNITPVAVTPEPSSLLLLGSGVLAAVGTLRRKAVAA